MRASAVVQVKRGAGMALLVNQTILLMILFSEDLSGWDGVLRLPGFLNGAELQVEAAKAGTTWATCLGEMCQTGCGNSDGPCCHWLNCPCQAERPVCWLIVSPPSKEGAVPEYSHNVGICVVATQGFQDKSCVDGTAASRGGEEGFLL